VTARAHQQNFRLTKEEKERFERVAKHYGLPIAAMVRMLIKREDDALGREVEAFEQRENL
jgi:antitoxin component of RelBE/YafQ-DinJ toxin-antitoxin module